MITTTILFSLLILLTHADQLPTRDSNAVWLTRASFTNTPSGGYVNFVLRSYDPSEVDYIYNQLSPCKNSIDSHTVAVREHIDDNVYLSLYSVNPHYTFTVENLRTYPGALLETGKAMGPPLEAFRDQLVRFSANVNVSNAHQLLLPSADYNTSAVSQQIAWRSASTTVFAIFMDRMPFTTDPTFQVLEPIVLFPPASIVKYTQTMLPERDPNLCTVDLQVTRPVFNITEIQGMYDNSLFMDGQFTHDSTRIVDGYVQYRFNVSRREDEHLTPGNLALSEERHKNVILFLPNLAVSVFCNGTDLSIVATNNGMWFDEFEYEISNGSYDGNVQDRVFTNTIHIPGNGTACYLQDGDNSIDWWGVWTSGSALAAGAAVGIGLVLVFWCLCCNVRKRGKKRLA